MKRLILVVILGCALATAAPAQSQTDTTQPSQLNVTATKIIEEGLVTHLIGKVVIKSDKWVMEADEADFNSDAHEIEVRGHITRHSVSAGGLSTTETADKMLIRVDKIIFQPSLSKP